jgi:hypothetical protein
VQEAYRTPNRTKKKKKKRKNTPRHNIIKTLNIENKERPLKTAKEKR